jgi:hypothetical protein
MGTPIAAEITALRGRNGWDSPLDVPEDIATEMRNMHRYAGALGCKRAGSTSQAIVGLTEVNALYRFQDAADPDHVHLVAVDNSATNKILWLSNSTALWTSLTLADAVQANDTEFSWASVNGKLYIAYNSAVNRLHVWDFAVDLTTVRRTGLGTPAAPTAANTGAGAYAAVLRYYAVAFTEQVAGVTTRRSNVSASVSFTPSGAGTAARVTKPATLSESETHWELYGSTDNVLFYLLSTAAVGTTTQDDSALTTTYANNTAAASAGTYTDWPSVKYLATDGNRLLGYGVWENTVGGSAVTAKNGRVYFSPVIDTTGTNDEERVSNTTSIKGYIDITRNSTSVDRGISPAPLNNAFYVFQDKGIAMLVPTEAPEQPYRRIVLSSQLGAVSNESLVMGEDEVGRPCLYFLDPEFGPYRVGSDGFQRVGKDVQDVWDTVNLAASVKVAWGLYYKSLNLVIWAIATGSSNEPDTMLVFDVTEGRLTDQDGIRNGWFVWDGDFAAARCGAMFSATVADPVPRKLVPYVGKTKLLRYDTTASLDDTTAFRAYVTSRAMTGTLWPSNKSVARTYLLATARPGVTIQQGWVRNFGDEVNRTEAVTLTPAGSETRLLRKFASPELQEAFAFQVQLGDAAAVASGWTFERWWAQVDEGGLT